MLNITDLNTYYGDSHILRGAGFELPAGTALGLLGRNGMGKTTLIRTVMGYVKPASGSIAWEGRPVTGSPPERMARLGIGYVPEGRGIFPNLSVRENLLMSARPGTAGQSDWSYERVLDTFPRLRERLSHGGQQLSGGEQQMLAIGRALLTQAAPADPRRSHRGPRPADRRRDLARDRHGARQRHQHADRRPRLPPRAGPHRPRGGDGKGPHRPGRRQRRAGPRPRCSVTVPRRLTRPTPLPNPLEKPVILELADIRIAPGKQAEFDAAIVRGVTTVISQAKGYRGYKVNKGIESPERYILMIFWETLENHTVDFRGGPLFPQWRAIVGPFFASPPVVEHFTLVDKSS